MIFVEKVLVSFVSILYKENGENAKLRSSTYTGYTPTFQYSSLKVVCLNRNKQIKKLKVPVY